VRTIGWGVAGCSDIVRLRAAAAIVAQPNSELVAFPSRDRDRAAAFAREHGAAAAYGDFDELLGDDRVDVVYVATEVDRHASLTIAAARAGKHVLVEKPMALDASECRAMLAAAAASNVHLAVAYYARFLEKARVMKQVIGEGRLGQVVRANVRVVGFYDPGPADPKRWRVLAGGIGRGGGNMLADVGSHRVDLLVYFLGRPARVLGLADRLSMDYEAADTETALVQFASGAHVTVLANTNVPHGGATSLEIYGTKGALLTDPWSDEPVRVIGSDAEPITIARPPNVHFPIIDDFARAIAEGRAPTVDAIEALWTTAVIAGVYESARTGRVVEIPE
jgi:predicted dehydrogenase